jgi:Uncharacterized bacitracin resistance protein
MTLFQSIIIAIIEGLTEFLPISSTGHMILASAAMGIHDDEFVKIFEVFIQLGAILAIALMYIKRFFRGLKIYYKLLAAFIPTAIVGLLAYDFIKGYLFNPVVVSVSLILGGVILILIDKKSGQSNLRLGRSGGYLLSKCLFHWAFSVSFHGSWHFPCRSDYYRWGFQWFRQKASDGVFFSTRRADHDGCGWI